ncbi:hypothetical protein M5K25_013581 [Dendrobium thyrsiflorum]|uniref:Uncharacterized protein n=1 Tax=Dendrobium thyrsiflorum TaxID=117978 RepID=A0ABD0UT87_DENTH
MSPDQGPEALLDGSNHNSDYQTVSKFDNLIIESSVSTRRIQRAQEHRNPTFLSQKIVHRTIHDQWIQYQPTLDPKLQEIKREIEDRSCPLAPPRPPPELRRTTSAGPLPEEPTLHSRPDVLPKAQRSAQSQTFCSRPDVLLKARRSAQGQTLYSRPDILLKARRSAQSPTFCSRPDILLRARCFAQGQTLCSRPDTPLKARRSAQGPTLRLRPDVLPVCHLTPDILPGHCRASTGCRSSANHYAYPMILKCALLSNFFCYPQRSSSNIVLFTCSQIPTFFNWPKCSSNNLLPIRELLKILPISHEFTRVKGFYPELFKGVFLGGLHPGPFYSALMRDIIFSYPDLIHRVCRTLRKLLWCIDFEVMITQSLNEWNNKFLKIKEFHHLALKVDGGGMDDEPDQDPMVFPSQAIVVPGLLKIDTIGEHTGTGHSYNLVVPFVSQQPSSEGLGHNHIPVVPFGGKTIS